MPQIACPVVLMQSALAMPGVGAGASVFLQEDTSTLSNVTTVRFEASHFIRRDAFDQYIAVVEAFLKEH